MNEAQAREFLRAVGTKGLEVSANWLRASCPLAFALHDHGTDSHPSFGIRLGPESGFHCWTCESGDLLWLVQLLSQYKAQAPKYDLKKALQLIAMEDDAEIVLNIQDYGPQNDDQKEHLFSESWLASFRKANEVPLAREYLDGRNISVEIAKLLDLRFDTGKKAVCLPIRNFKGQLVGLRGRYVDPDATVRFHDYATGFNQRNKLPWWGEHLVDFDKPVLMVESWADIASVYRVYRNVLAPLSVGMSKAKLLRVADALDIVSLFDNGKGGDKARSLVQKYLPGSIQQHLKPYPDPQNPDKKTDPNDMSVEQLVELFGPYLPLDEIIP